MGSSNSTTNQSQQSTSAPGEMTAPTVQGITGQLNPLIANSGTTAPETTAINQLTAAGEAGNPYATAIGNNANTLLSGGGATSQNGALSGNLSTLQSEEGAMATPGYSTLNTPAVQQALQAANAGITNQVNGEFAAAGRSGSTANTGNLAYNEEQADAPILLNQANTDTANQVSAANNLYGAGNTTSNALTTNNQTALGNEQTGSTEATDALNAANWGPQQTITAQQLGQSIPASNLGLLSQIGIPLAGLNTTQSGTGTSTTNASPSLLQDITGLGGILGSGAGTTANGATTSGSGIMGLLGML